MKNRLIDTKSVINLTNVTSITGAGIFSVGMAMAQSGIPNLQIIGGVLIVTGVIVSAIKGS